MSTGVLHPSAYLDKATVAALRESALKAEALGRLHDDQLRVIYAQHWFDMFVPVSLGGLGLSLPEALKVEESLAWTDGSVGWVVTLCSGAAWFVGFLAPALTREVLSDPYHCFAGSGAVTGTAEETSEGYIINGFWKYATGSSHATIFTMNCHLVRNGVRVEKDGVPVVCTFLLKRDQVIIHDTWHSMGMVATGSHAFEVRRRSVPAIQSFVIIGDHATLPDMVYRYPFLQLAETTLAVNLSGMAVRFMDLCQERFSSRGEPLRELEVVRKNHETSRTEFYRLVGASWEMMASGNKVGDALLAGVSARSRTLARDSREAVNKLYPLCGLSAADTREEINRVWRNLHTAGQHALFA